jgi:hypothetical protein
MRDHAELVGVAGSLCRYGLELSSCAKVLLVQRPPCRRCHSTQLPFYAIVFVTIWMVVTRVGSKGIPRLGFRRGRQHRFVGCQGKKEIQLVIESNHRDTCNFLGTEGRLEGVETHIRYGYDL